MHDLLDELNDFKNALVKLSSVFTNQTDALNRKATKNYSNFKFIQVQYYAILLHSEIQHGIGKVALKRILGLYHAKECDEVDLDKQIANLGIGFKIFMTRVDFNF